jgi:hypothetical protein
VTEPGYLTTGWGGKPEVESWLVRMDPKDMKELIHEDDMQRTLAAFFLLLKSQEVMHGRKH